MTLSMDLVNGVFEFGGALLLLLNVRRLARDRHLAGVHWSPTVFFTAWGVWNLFYYPSLDQPWSFAGGVCLVCVNAFWLGQIAYFAAIAEHESQLTYLRVVESRCRCDSPVADEPDIVSMTGLRSHPRSGGGT